MTQFNDILSQLSDRKVLKNLGKSVQAKPDQVKKLVDLGIPTLVSALQKNASTPSGAKSLAKALDQHQNDPVEDLFGFLGQVDTQDGSKIIGHILGAKTQTVEKKLGVQTGLDMNQVASLLSMLAPLLLSSLGKQKSNQGVNASGLGGLLGGLLGGSGQDLAGLASGFLDADKDGDIMDDVGNLLSGFLKK